MLVKMQPKQHAAVEAVYEDMEGQLDYPPGSGQMIDSGEWHQVMLNGFAKEMGWTSRFLPSLDGRELVPVMRTRQSRLTRKQGSDLIEFCKAYAINRGATLREWDEDGNQVVHQPEMRRAA